MATKVITGGEDTGLQGHTAWLLGRLYLGSSSLTDSKSAGEVVGHSLGPVRVKLHFYLNH